MRRFGIKATLLAAAIAALAGGMAIADSDDTMRGRGMGYGMGHGMGYGMGRMMSDDWMRGMMRGFGPMMGYSADAMLDRMDGRLAFIKTELKIRDDQTEKWDSFAKVMRENAETHNSMMRSMWGDDDDGYRSKPLPERLAIHEAHMEAGLEQMKTVRVAVDDLYGVLDDDQKKTADEIMMPMMGFGMGMMMMH